MLLLLSVLACEEKHSDTSAIIEPETISATLHLLSAVNGSNQEGVMVQSDFDEINSPTGDDGKAAVFVEQSSFYSIRASKDDSMEHIYQGQAGTEDFEIVGFFVDRSTTETVYAYLGKEVEAGKGIVVAALDYPDLSPVYGASANLDSSNDSFVFGSQSIPKEGNQLEEGGSSFVFFPNLDPGTVKLSIQAPAEVSCHSFPAGEPDVEYSVDVYADSVSIVVFQCDDSLSQ